MLCSAWPQEAQAQPARKALKVYVDFDSWGTAEERARIKELMKIQLENEWGADIVVPPTPGNPGGLVRGVDITVVEGGYPPPGSLGVKINNSVPSSVPDKYKSSLGLTYLGRRQTSVYASNFGDYGWFYGDRILCIEKTIIHELGHVACGSDQNERTVADKMAQTWRRIDVSVGRTNAHKDKNPSSEDINKFTEYQSKNTFSKEDRIKMLININHYIEKKGHPCDSWIPTDPSPTPTPTPIPPPARPKGTVFIYDDPAGEMDFDGTVNFAITASGSNWSNYNLGFLNPGEDLISGTDDDWVNVKWLGNRDFDGDGVNDSANDRVVSLFNECGYTFCALDSLTNEVYTLEECGSATLSEPVYNADYDATVYRQADLSFDFNSDGIADLTYNLNADLSLITVADGSPAYMANKLPTGFTTTFVPEPLAVSLLAMIAVGWLRRGK
jgi:hypothetical protein